MLTRSIAMLYPPMTTIQLTKLHYSIKANKYQVAVLYLYYRPVAKSEFVYFLCLVTDRQIQPLIEQIRKQIPIHMQGNGYPDVFAFNK